MAYTRTLTQLRTAITRRGGFSNSTDLTASVLNEMINDALMESYEIMVGKWADYYTTSTTGALSSGTAAYAVPSDFYKLRKVELLVTGTEYERLYPHDLEEAHKYSSSTGRPVRYRLQARNLVFVPTPNATYTYRIYYIPIRTELSADGDTVTFDVPVEQKLLLAIVMRDCMDRQELDPSSWIEKIDRYSAQLRTSADSRDAGEPFYIDASGPPRVYDDDTEYWP